LRDRYSPSDCWRGAHAITLSPQP